LVTLLTKGKRVGVLGSRFGWTSVVSPKNVTIQIKVFMSSRQERYFNVGWDTNRGTVWWQLLCY